MASRTGKSPASKINPAARRLLRPSWPLALHLRLIRHHGSWKFKLIYVFISTIGFIALMMNILMLHQGFYKGTSQILQLQQQHQHNYDESKNKKSEEMIATTYLKQHRDQHDQQQLQEKLFIETVAKNSLATRVTKETRNISTITSADNASDVPHHDQEESRDRHSIRSGPPNSHFEKKNGSALPRPMGNQSASAFREKAANGGNETSTSGSSSALDTTDKKATTPRLRQFSNRFTHHATSQCPRDIHQTRIGTTLVTQTTLDRLPFLKETCQRWSSPIVVVVCLSPQEWKSKWEDIQASYSKICPHMKMVTFTLEEEEKTYKYPINRLRNMGLDQVETSHVFLIDADFIPSVDLDKAILKSIQIVTMQDEEVFSKIQNKSEVAVPPSSSKFTNSPTLLYQYHALVVPAFERKVDSPACKVKDVEACLDYTSQDPEFMPRSMESLLNCTTSTSTNNDNRKSQQLQDDKSSPNCIVFHSDYFPWGHLNTNTDKWLADMDRESVRPIPCIDTDFYEPYLAIPWCPSEKFNRDTAESKIMSNAGTTEIRNVVEPWAPLSPYYDERFYGYGKNKMQHILHLQSVGYAFSVIPSLGFLIHHPHPASKTKRHWKEMSKYSEDDEEYSRNIKAKMKRLYRRFSRALEKEYDGQFYLPTKACLEEE